MTRNQWIVHWREQRIKKKAEYNKHLTAKELNEIFREVYDYSYLPKQQVFISLFERYKKKASPEFVSKAEQQINFWRPQAKERARVMWTSLVYSENPLLKMIKKDSFKGKYVPVPL